MVLGCRCRRLNRIRRRRLRRLEKSPTKNTDQSSFRRAVFLRSFESVSVDDATFGDFEAVHKADEINAGDRL